MDRLHTELQRLFFSAPSTDGATPSLLTPQGLSRSLVLEWHLPLNWPDLSALWQALQDDLGLPAPAMAVSGLDAVQFWLSLAEPVSTDSAQTFAQALVQRYLPGTAATAWRVWPHQPLDGMPPPQHTRPVPAQQPDRGTWSAFVSPGLASMFTDEPWLDEAPSRDAQADLLLRLTPASPTAWATAQARLRSAIAPAAESTGHATTDASLLTPQSFLLQVMRDPHQPMALRVDAAKALLPTATR